MLGLCVLFVFCCFGVRCSVFGVLVSALRCLVCGGWRVEGGSCLFFRRPNLGVYMIFMYERWQNRPYPVPLWPKSGTFLFFQSSPRPQDAISSANAGLHPTMATFPPGKTVCGYSTRKRYLIYSPLPDSGWTVRPHRPNDPPRTI